MDDAISRAKVFKFLNRMEETVAGSDLISKTAMATIKCARRYVTAIPSVDAVHVVRCADCAHCQYDAVYGDRWCDGRRVKPDHYCGYGKRRTENVDRCVCCGELVPEGRMVCPVCERRAGE